MAKIQLTMKSLKDLDDGRVDRQFQAILNNAAADCLSRPLEKKGRKVAIEIELIPLPEDGPDGTVCHTVAGQIQITSKIPAMRSKTLSFGLHPNAALSFNPDSPGNVDQGTFAHDDDED